MSKKPPLPIVWAMQEAYRRCYPPTEALILIWLANCMNGGVCSPSVEWLASRCRCSVRQVQRALPRFRTDGLIAYQPGGNGYANRTVYQLLADNVRNGRHADLFEPNGRVTHSHPKRVTHSHPKSRILGDSESQSRVTLSRTESTKENPLLGTALRAVAKKPDREPDNFGAFYDRYPRKVARRQAAKAFAAALARGATPAEILAGLERHQFNPDPQYQPHPATWLNGDRWLDPGTPAKRAATAQLRERWNLPTFLAPEIAK
jgi:hypothetical protein